MRGLGVERRVVTRDELLQIEPALRPFASEVVGGTYTASDESGDAVYSHKRWQNTLWRKVAWHVTNWLSKHS